MKITQVVLFTLLISTVFGGCIWIDDDNGSYVPGGNGEETIIYINRTEFVIDNYIDGDLVGSVGPYDTFHVYSQYLDGRHSYESLCRDCDLTWGPTVFTLWDGEEFRIYLEETGMRFESSSNKIHKNLL